MCHTVDGRNVANQLIGSLSVYPIISRVLKIPGGYPDFFHQKYHLISQSLQPGNDATDETPKDRQGVSSTEIISCLKEPREEREPSDCDDELLALQLFLHTSKLDL